MKNELGTSKEFRLWLNANEHLHNWNSEKIAKLYHKQQSILNVSSLQLKDKNKTVIEELEKDLKEWDKDLENELVNDLKWLRHTSFVKGKLAILHSL